MCRVCLSHAQPKLPPCPTEATTVSRRDCAEHGARVAALRKDQGMTQVQFAEILGLTQQMIASYEVGRRRVPVSILPQIAETLTVSLEELIGKKDVQPAKRGPAPKFQQQIERIQQLPRAKQRFVIEMLDTVLQQTAR